MARRPGEHHEEDRLSALLDDELPDEDALEVTRHLAGCARCMAEVERIRDARTALRSLPAVDPPPRVLDEVERIAADWHGRRRRRWRRMAAAGASLAVLGAVVFTVGEDSGTVVPPVDTFVADHVTRVGGGPMVTPVDLEPTGP